MTNQVSRTVNVPKEQDEFLRAYLTRQGTKKSDLSLLVEDTVEARLFELTMQEAKQRNRKYPQEEIMEAIDQALANG